MADAPKILVAGIGNIFLGDDAFGSEVVRRLEGRSWPDGVRVIDFGIRGLDLVYALCDGYDLTLLVDATPRGGIPGTLYVIEPDLSELTGGDSPGVTVDPHSLDPMQVLRAARSQGANFKKIIVVGCEPGDIGGEEGRLGLSEPVAAAIDEALDLVTLLVRNFLEHGTVDAGSSPSDLAFGKQRAMLESSERETHIKGVRS
jgi:hydrogenase maturation protease